MKLELKCLECFINQAVRAAKLATCDFDKQITAVKKAAAEIAVLNPDSPPPAIATGVFKAVIYATGNPDAFSELKKQSNRTVKKLLGRVTGIISSSKDPFSSSVKAALCGNIIDYGILDNFNVAEVIRREISADFEQNKIKKIKRIISKSKEIVFFADNAGEIGLDGRMLNEFRKINPGIRINIFVIDKPIINDATIEDLKFFRMDKSFKIYRRPNTVGVDIGKLPEKLKKVVVRSDYIISKGQANYEMLTDSGLKNIVYLLRAKCDVVARHAGVREGSPVIIVKSEG